MPQFSPEFGPTALRHCVCERRDIGSDARFFFAYSTRSLIRVGGARRYRLHQRRHLPPSPQGLPANGIGPRKPELLHPPHILSRYLNCRLSTATRC
jgi:hypothetical protein